MTAPNAFNLIDEPWIPVLLQDGSTRRVSLGDIFADASGDIADLALNPYERVAVFRLLLCVAQAALGPERLADESAWRAAKSLVAPVSTDYLRRWRPRFFLYGPNAFLQVDNVKPAPSSKVPFCAKLFPRLAVGNNSTLFDHAARMARLFPDHALALGVVAYQNFSADGGSPQCVWDGILTPFRGVRAAPCREQSLLLAILKGSNLLESVWMNLLTNQMVHDSLRIEWGVPAWELQDLSREGTQALTRGLLGRLAPLARVIKLSQGSPFCLIGEGLRYPQLPEWREPMATVQLKKDNTLAYISSDLARLPWRDLSSILLLRPSGSRSGPIALRHLTTLGDADFTLWTGGLCTDQAKEVATVEWAAHLSVAWLGEPTLRAYESAMAEADAQSSRLRTAVLAYAQNVKPVAQDKNQRSKDLAPYAVPADRAYWDLLAQPENQRLVQAVDSPSYLADWRNAILSAAEKSYSRACPAMTARQMEAFAQGFAKLRVPDHAAPST